MEMDLRPEPPLLTNKQRRNMRDYEAKIAFAMIIKNEATRLHLCLKSIRPFAHDIIIVDTGSTDDSVRIARGLGATVFEHPWKGRWDFSKARNMSIEYAEKTKCDWIFIIDGDEWLRSLRDGDYLLIAAKKGIGQFDGFQANVHSTFKSVGQAGTWLEQVRMFRTDGTWRYAGYVHNQLLQHGKIGHLPTALEHSGYDLNPEEMAEKHKRSCTLLLQQIHETHGKRSFPWFNLIKQYAGNKEWRKSLYCGEKAIPLVEGEDRLKAHHPMLSVIHLTAHAAIQCGEWQKAIDFSKRGTEINPDFPDHWFDLLQAYSSINDIEKMEDAYEHFIDTCKRTRNGELHFSQEVTRTDFEAQAEFYRAFAYEHTGKKEKGEECLKLARKKNPNWAIPALMLGRLYRQKGKAKDALEAYGDAAAADPSANNLAELAEMMCIVGEKESAIKFMRFSGQKFEADGRKDKAQQAKDWIDKLIAQEGEEDDNGGDLAEESAGEVEAPQDWNADSPVC